MAAHKKSPDLGDSFPVPVADIFGSFIVCSLGIIIIIIIIEIHTFFYRQSRDQRAFPTAYENTVFTSLYSSRCWPPLLHARPIQFVCFGLCTKLYLRSYRWLVFLSLQPYADLFHRPDDRALRRHTIFSLYNTCSLAVYYKNKHLHFVKYLIKHHCALIIDNRYITAT